MFCRAVPLGVRGVVNPVITPIEVDRRGCFDVLTRSIVLHTLRKVHMRAAFNPRQ